MTHGPHTNQPSQSPPHPQQSPPRRRRSDAGRIRLNARDITGLTLVAHHYAAPYDLLARAMGVTETGLRKMTARWRHAGLAETDRLASGPAWCWLTPAGIAHLGYDWPANPPALARLAHIRAALAVRLWLEAGEAYQAHRARWISERHLRAALRRNVGLAHIADAEIHWPSVPASPYAGEAWAIEVELTPKTLGRTQEIIAELMARPYSRVVYLVSQPAAPIVQRAAATLHESQAGRLSIRPVPPSALMPARETRPCG